MKPSGRARTRPPSWRLFYCPSHEGTDDVDDQDGRGYGAEIGFLGERPLADAGGRLSLFRSRFHGVGRPRPARADARAGTGDVARADGADGRGSRSAERRVGNEWVKTVSSR